MKNRLTPIIIVLLSAFLFGLSTPLCKLFVGDISAQMMAALLYLGSGLGMTLTAALRSGLKTRTSRLSAREWLWFITAMIFGGIAAPVALLLGLKAVSAASASLLLNLEGVFTALLAWFAFKENFDKRIAIGMIFIVASGLILCWQPVAIKDWQGGALLIVLACLFWAIDNNLMRKVSAADPIELAAIKGWVGGSANLVIATAFGAQVPAFGAMLPVLGIGFVSYGVSFCLFILALRHLGTARTGAYFSTAPFIGTVVSLVLFNSNTSPQFWLAGCLAAIGVWLHISEKHEHEHLHLEMEHDHSHKHDEHHQHNHDGSELVGELHSHKHKHTQLKHHHDHYPDIHHRHEH